MVTFVILISLLVFIFCYVLVSFYEKSLIHVLTPALFVFFPSYYVFELVYIYTADNRQVEHNLAGYVFFYFIYALSILMFSTGYVFSVKKKITLLSIRKISDSCFCNAKTYSFFAVLFSIISLFLYTPIIVEFSQYIASPRKIYELTRTGYGSSFFISILTSVLAILFSFYVYRKKKVLSLLVVFLNAVLIYLHGNKGPIIILFLSWLLYRRYIEEKSFSIKQLMIYGVSVSVVIIAFFYFTFQVELNSILEAMAGYSDYTRNAILLFNSDLSMQWGKLFFESEFYSRVPRALYPEKPMDFGYFYLAKHFFPDRFYLNQGAPSFGYGEYYSDFGYMTPFVVAILFFLKGLLLGFFRNLLLIRKDIYILIPFLFLSGLSLLSLGMGWLFPEHMFISLIIYTAINVRGKNVYKFK